MNEKKRIISSLAILLIVSYSSFAYVIHNSKKISSVDIQAQVVSKQTSEFLLLANSDESMSMDHGSPNVPSHNSITSENKLYFPIELEIISWPLKKAYPGLEYNIRVGAIGGHYPYVYSLEEAPKDMKIDQSTGEISWIPDVNLQDASVSVRLSVRDKNNKKIMQRFNINVTSKDFYFVSSNGSDSIGNGSIKKPWKTMDFAAEKAGANGILYVREGIYKGEIDLSALDCNKWIAYPGEKPVLDLNLTTIWPKSNYGYIDGLEIMNGQHWAFSFSKKVNNWVFRRNHMHHLYDNSYSENPAFIFFWNQDTPDQRGYQNIIIQDNHFHDIYDRASGINGDLSADYQAGSAVMFDVYKALYENNQAHDIDGFGVKDKDHGQFNTFRGNYFHDNAKTAFSLSNQGFSNNIDISFNIFIGSVFIGQEAWNIKNIIFRKNTVIGQIMHKSAKPVGEKNTIVFLDNIISMKKEDREKIIDSADSETYSAFPYLCCNEADGRGFVGSTVYRNYNLIDFNTPYIAGWGWGESINRTLDEWQALGFDLDSIFSDPEFNDYESKDFRPKASSAACGAAHDGSDIGALKCLE